MHAVENQPTNWYIGEKHIKIMKIEMPENVNLIIRRLTVNGYEAYAVGGCVRDRLLGRDPMDWDITTSAKPEQVKELFDHTIDTGIQHGTVTVMMNHVGYEVTTYRIDGEYEDSRHPKEVTFTANLIEDLKRRDFTINAMAYNHEQGLVDAFDGLGDLQRGIIRCVGNPEHRFSEDALRMLRAVRFAAQLGFDIEAETKLAIGELAYTLDKISAERIQVELVKLLTSDNPDRIRTAYELGLTRVFLPEFDEMMETAQANKHHMYSVGEHTLVCLKNIRKDKVLRLSMLLHDVGKPACKTTDEEGTDHFDGHPQVGAKMARDIFRRLKFDNKTTDACCRLIEHHDDRPEVTENNIRHAMNRIGIEAFPDIFEIKRADILGQSWYHRQEKLDYIMHFQQTYEKIISEKQCFQKKDMAISGKTLISMGVAPGREMGQILEELFRMVLDDPSLNSEEKLIDIVHKKINPLIG